jgi:hypothetical protein
MYTLNPNLGAIIGVQLGLYALNKFLHGRIDERHKMITTLALSTISACASLYWLYKYPPFPIFIDEFDCKPSEQCRVYLHEAHPEMHLTDDVSCIEQGFKGTCLVYLSRQGEEKWGHLSDTLFFKYIKTGWSLPSFP